MKRSTQQTQAIVDTLRKVDQLLSPQEILCLSVRISPGLGIATVYRALRRLLGSGELTCVQIPGCPPRYELCGRSHHHYFRCRSCRSIFNVEGCTGNFQAVTPRGFRLEDHELVLYGLCNRCVGDKGKGKPPHRRR